MEATDHEIRVYRGEMDSRLGGRCSVEVEGFDGIHPLINHMETDFAWGYGGAGPSTLALCIVIDTLGRDARCKQCADGGIDPDGRRDEAICRECGGDGWSDLVALAGPVVRDQLIVPLDQDAPFQFTSDEVMSIILPVCMDPNQY